MKTAVDRRGILVRLGAAVLVLNLVTIAIAWWAIADRRAAIYERAGTNARNLAQVLAHDVTSALDKSDGAIATVIDDIMDHGIDSAAARAQVRTTAAAELARRPETHSLRIVDARGDIIEGAGTPYAGRVNIADRDYFRRLQANPDAGLVISEPVVGRIGGKRGIVLARAFKGPDGKFAGIVFAMALGASFESQFSALEVGPRGSILLTRENLAVIAGFARSNATGENDALRPPAGLPDRLHESPAEGGFVGSDAAEGELLSYAYRRLTRYPLLVVVSQDMSIALAQWRRNTMIGVSLITLYVAATLLLFWLVLRSWERRDAAAASLAQREEEFKHMSALMPGMISQFQSFPDGRSCMPYVSEAIREIFELSPEDVRDDATPMVERIHPDDAARRMAAVAESARTLARYQCEYRVLLPVKGERWLRADSQPEKRADGSIVWHGYISDITAQRQIEQALQEGEAQLTGILEATADGILAVSREGRVLRANARFAAMWGISPELLASGDDRALLKQVLEQLADPDAFLQKVEVLYQTDAVDVDTLAFKDGRHFERVSYPLIRDGALFGRVWSFSDISERMNAHAEALAARAKLEATLDAVPDLLFEVGESGIVHDYHSPRTELLTARPEEFLGKKFADILPAEASQVCMDALREAQATGRSAGKQYALQLPVGLRWFELSVSRKPVSPGQDARYIYLARDITGRSDAEAALRESEARFRSLTELGSDWYWEQDEQFRFTHVSSGIEKDARLSPQEHIGKARWELSFEGMDPLTWERHRVMLDRHLPYANFEMTRRDMDGNLRVISSSGEPVFDASGQFRGYRGVGSDITARKALESQLKQQLAFNEAIINAEVNGLAVYRFIAESPFVRFTVWNPAMQQLTGYTMEEVNRLGLDATIYANVQAEPANVRMARIRQGVHLRAEERTFRHKDGSPRIIEISTVTVAEDAQGPHVLAVIYDLSERKRLEATLHKLNEELELNVAERTRSLVEANAELQTITYTLAHDLRAPARQVAGFASLFIEEYGPLLQDRGKRWLDLMKASANRQAELIEDMLSYMKLGFKAVEAEPLDMNALAAGVVQSIVESEAGVDRIEWQVGDLAAIHADRALVRVILSNLITNAVKYSARATRPRIEIGCTPDVDHRFAYFVRDNGVGFDSAKAARLFGLFQRFHDPAQFPGVGIGLAIVKRLVEKHGGRVWAESSPGAGATFFFTFHD